MAETPAAAVVWTGASGQGDGSNSGAASVLNSPHIKIEQPKNPYEDIAKDILAQRAKDELAKAKSEKEASELLFKLQGELKLDNLTDYYQKEGNKEIELMSNELGRMKAEGVSMDKITDRQREFKRKLQGLDNQMKQIDTTYNKWIEKGAQITDPKYNKPQYERVMTDVNRLIDEGDMEAVLEYTRDPKNQPLILNLDSGEWIKNMGIDDKMTDQQLNDLVDVGLANDLKAGGDEVQTFMSQGYGTNAEEVAKNLKAEARKRYPYNPPKVSTSTSGGGGSDSFVYTPEYNGDGSYNVIISRSGTNDNLNPIDVGGKDFQITKVNFSKDGVPISVVGNEVAIAEKPDNWDSMDSMDRLVWLQTNSKPTKTNKVVPYSQVKDVLKNQLKNTDIGEVGKRYVKRGTTTTAKTGSKTDYGKLKKKK